MTVYKKRAAVSKIHMLKATHMQDFLFFLLIAEIFVHSLDQLVFVNGCKVSEFNVALSARHDEFFVCRMVHVVGKEIHLILVFQHFPIHRLKFFRKKECPLREDSAQLIMPVNMSADNDYVLIHDRFFSWNQYYRPKQPDYHLRSSSDKQSSGEQQVLSVRLSMLEVAG